MLKIRDGIQIYVSLSAIDMRKSIDSLSALVIEEFKERMGSRLILHQVVNLKFLAIILS